MFLLKQVENKMDKLQIYICKAIRELRSNEEWVN